MTHPGAYRGNKRQKELRRLEKQEEKRQKRFTKAGELITGEEGEPTEDGLPQADAPETEPPSVPPKPPAGPVDPPSGPASV